MKNIKPMTDHKTPNSDHAGPTLVTAENAARNDGHQDNKTNMAWVIRFWPLLLSALLSILWIGLCLWWFMESGKTLARMPVYEAGGLLSGTSLPLILIWLMALVYLRTDPLRDQRTALTRGMGDLITPLDVVQRRVNAIVTQLHKQIKHVEMAGDVAATRIDSLENRFQEQISNLFEVTANAEARAANLQESLSSERDAFTKLVTDVTAQTSELETLFKQITFDSETLTNTTRNNARDVSAELAVQNETLVARTGLVTAQIDSFSGFSGEVDDICGKLDSQAKIITALSQETAAQSEKITTTLQEQNVSLSTAAHDAMERSRQSGEVFQTQADSMTNKLEQISDFITNQGGDFTRNMENNLTAIEDQAKRVDMAVTLTTDSLDKNAEQMTRHCDDFEQQAETTRSQIAQSENMFKVTHDDIINSLSQVADHLDHSLSELKEHTSTLGDHSGQIINDIISQNEQLSGHIDDIRTRTENTMGDIKEMSAAVAKSFTTTDVQAAALSENWQKTASLVENQCVDTLLKLEKLTDTLAEIKQENTLAADNADDNISKVSEQMQHASESIYLASASAMEAADETSQLIDQHGKKFQQLINALQLSNKSILIDAEAIEQKNRDKVGRHFSELASRVIEQLQSLSIDINRYFEDDVPDKVWQTYVDGDKNAFVRRLKKMTDKKYAEAISEKYKTDGEFRKHVLEYIQIFEELISQSMVSDSYSTFSVAMISSETGKIYLALAHAVGRFNE